MFPGSLAASSCITSSKAQCSTIPSPVSGEGWGEGIMRQILLGLVFVLSLSSILPRADAAPLRIASSGLSGELLPLWIAQDRLVFKKHGFDTEVITIQGGPLAIQALASGSVQFHAGGT